MADPINLDEPEIDDRLENEDSVWMRGLWMLVLAFLFGVAQTILAVSAVIQFFWMLFTDERNEFLMEFGRGVGTWLEQVAHFQTGSTDEKPFPWKRWG